MTKEQIYNTIEEYYEHIYRRVMRYNDFVFSPTENQKKQINNFIGFLNEKIGFESIGKEWIWNYLIYLFKQRVEQKTRYKDKIPINWILGQKAYQLYEKRNESWVYFNEMFIEERQIIKKEFNEKLVIETKEYYENLRKQYCNTELPLSYCLNTVPYKETSIFCMQCKDKKDCKVLNC